MKRSFSQASHLMKSKLWIRFSMFVRIALLITDIVTTKKLHGNQGLLIYLYCAMYITYTNLSYNSCMYIRYTHLTSFFPPFVSPEKQTQIPYIPSNMIRILILIFHSILFRRGYCILILNYLNLFLMSNVMQTPQQIQPESRSRQSRMSGIVSPLVASSRLSYWDVTRMLMINGLCDCLMILISAISQEGALLRLVGFIYQMITSRWSVQG